MEKVKKFDKKLKIKIITQDESYSLNETDTSNLKALNLYFYSAPYNIYFLKRHFDYIAFKFLKEEISNEFETFNVLLYKEEILNDNSEIISRLNVLIEDFHKTIFTTAANEPDNLNDIYLAYKNISKSKTPFNIFDSVYSYAQCLTLHSIDEPSESNRDDIWDNLFNIKSRRGAYVSDLTDNLIDLVKQIYIVLSLFYLSKKYDGIQGIQTVEYSTICELFHDNILSEGSYYRFFIDFIKAQALSIILKYESINNSYIHTAIKKGIKKECILQFLTYHSEKTFNDELKLLKPDDIIKIRDGQLNLSIELQGIQQTLSENSEILYTCVECLGKSLEKITQRYDSLIKQFYDNIEYLKSNTFYNMRFNNPQLPSILERHCNKST